jgi:hypothetical protein
MNALPKGWVETTLESLVSPAGLVTDGDWVESKDQDPDGDVRLIQLADIGDGEFRNKSARYLTTEKAMELGCTFLAIGDVLIARMPDPLGRACIFPGLYQPAVTVVDVLVFRSGTDLVPSEWVMRAINAPASRQLSAPNRSIGVSHGSDPGAWLIGHEQQIGDAPRSDLCCPSRSVYARRIQRLVADPRRPRR